MTNSTIRSIIFLNCDVLGLSARDRARHSEARPALDLREAQIEVSADREHGGV
jgi:hypothetical protein